MKCVLIIAHPDDELVWFYNLIKLISNHCIDIIVISLTGKNEERSREFEDSCNIFGAKFFMLDNPTRPASTQLNISLGLILEILNQKKMPLTKNDIIVSHGPEGDDTRHPHHIAAYGLAANLAKSNSCVHLFSGNVLSNQLEFNLPMGVLRGFGSGVWVGPFKLAFSIRRPVIRWSVDIVDSSSEKLQAHVSVYSSVGGSNGFVKYRGPSVGWNIIQGSSFSSFKLMQSLTWQRPIAIGSSI